MVRYPCKYRRVRAYRMIWSDGPPHGCPSNSSSVRCSPQSDPNTIYTSMQYACIYVWFNIMYCFVGAIVFQEPL